MSRGEVGLAADGAAGVHKLVQAEAVGVLLAPEGGAGGTLVGGAETVTPVVGIRKAAARPAQERSLNCLHSVDEGLADAVGVRDFRVGANPDAVVNHAAQMLNKVAVDLGRDGRDRLRRKDVDVRVSSGGRLREEAGAAEGQGGGSESGGLESSAAGDFHGSAKITDVAPRHRRQVSCIQSTDCRSPCESNTLQISSRSQWSADGIPSKLYQSRAP